MKKNNKRTRKAQGAEPKATKGCPTREFMDGLEVGVDTGVAMSKREAPISGVKLKKLQAIELKVREVFKHLPEQAIKDIIDIQLKHDIANLEAKLAELMASIYQLRIKQVVCPVDEIDSVIETGKAIEAKQHKASIIRSTIEALR